MLPFFHFLGRDISMYGLSAAVGVLMSVAWLYGVSKRTGIPGYDFSLVYVFCVVGAFLGAKILWLAQNIDAFIADIKYFPDYPLEFINMYLSGGFVFFGGLFGILAGFAVACRIYHLDFWRMAGNMLPVVPLVHGFGRIGCFFAGCCYGKETSGAIYAIFTRSEFAPNGVKLVPIQLYEAAALFLIFFVLSTMRSRSHGARCLGLYILLYSAVRFVLEFWRGDTYRGFIGPFSVSQAISLALLPAAIFLLVSKHYSQVRQRV